MKKRVGVLILIATGSLLIAAMSAAKPHHRVLFDASTGEETWESILNNVENMQKEFAGETIEIEVVVHGKALGLLLRDGKHAERVTRISATGVVFVACANTMRRQKVERDALLPAAGVVPAGVAELVRRQEAGWTYIKVGS